MDCGKNDVSHLFNGGGIMRRVLVGIAVLSFASICFVCQAVENLLGELQQLKIRSEKMGKDVPVTIILPDKYKESKTKYPSLYLLHGASNNQNTWLDRTGIRQLASQYNVIVVCPDAGRTSWYFDSSEDPKYQYETFISTELVTYIDVKYRTKKDRSQRAIAGCSMGGHGAMFLAIRHKDTFGLASAMSGGVDIRPFSENWDIKKRLGDIKEHADRWEALTVINLIDLLKDGELAISIDCGVNDFFLDVNRALHKKLVENKINHDYTERFGGHGWDYWKNSIKYQMLFFSEQFSK